MRRVENVLAGAVSGPPGRFLAFVADFVAALWRGLRGRAPIATIEGFVRQIVGRGRSSSPGRT